MSTYDLYGSESLSLDSVRETIQSLLDLRFVERESDYLGFYCTADGLADEEIMIQSNRVDFPDEGELINEHFPQHKVLISVNKTRRGDEIKDLFSSLEGIDFLNREIV